MWKKKKLGGLKKINREDLKKKKILKHKAESILVFGKLNVLVVKSFSKLEIENTSLESL